MFSLNVPSTSAPFGSAAKVMFQYSIPTSKVGMPDLTDLYSMIRHFEDVGRPAGLVYDDGQFSVWRNGVGQFSEQKVSNDPSGVLLIYVIGFDKIWQKAGGRLGKREAPAKV
jgi:hypothetical protein